MVDLKTFIKNNTIPIAVAFGTMLIMAVSMTVHVRYPAISEYISNRYDEWVYRRRIRREDLEMQRRSTEITRT